MNLEEKLFKVDQLIKTIATCDDEEYSAVLAALSHVKVIVDKHEQETAKRRNARADSLREFLASAQK
jgi:hypothetical protein